MIVVVHPYVRPSQLGGFVYGLRIETIGRPAIMAHMGHSESKAEADSWALSLDIQSKRPVNNGP